MEYLVWYKEIIIYTKIKIKQLFFNFIIINGSIFFKTQLFLRAFLLFIYLFFFIGFHRPLRLIAATAHCTPFIPICLSLQKKSFQFSIPIDILSPLILACYICLGFPLNLFVLGFHLIIWPTCPCALRACPVHRNRVLFINTTVPGSPYISSISLFVLFKNSSVLFGPRMLSVVSSSPVLPAYFRPLLSHKRLGLFVLFVLYIKICL